MKWLSWLTVTGALLAGPMSATADDPPDKLKVELSRSEKAILDLTNQAREKAKLAPLKPHPVLCQMARAHSKNMAMQEKLAHELDGKDPGKRAQDAGYKFAYLGENIAAGDDLSAAEAFKLWMNSPQHKDNMLKPEFNQIGIGIYKNDKGQVYYTQVFGTEP